MFIQELWRNMMGCRCRGSVFSQSWKYQVWNWVRGFAFVCHWGLGKTAVLNQQDASTWAQKLSLFIKVPFEQRETKGKEKQQTLQIPVTLFRNYYFVLRRWARSIHLPAVYLQNEVFQFLKFVVRVCISFVFFSYLNRFLFRTCSFFVGFVYCQYYSITIVPILIHKLREQRVRSLLLGFCMSVCSWDICSEYRSPALWKCSQANTQSM